MQEELCQRAVHLFDRLGSHREDGEGWREKILAGPVEVMRVRARRQWKRNSGPLYHK